MIGSATSCASNICFSFLLAVGPAQGLLLPMYVTSIPSSSYSISFLGVPPGHHIRFLVQFPAEHLPAAVGGYVDHLIIKPDRKAQYRMPLRSGSARLCLFRKRTLDRQFACNLGGKEAYLEAGTWGSRGGVFGEIFACGCGQGEDAISFFFSFFSFLDRVL